MKDPKNETPLKPEDLKADHAVEERIETSNDPFESDGFPTSLNDELVEKIKDNPNKFIGCGS